MIDGAVTQHRENLKRQLSLPEIAEDSKGQVTPEFAYAEPRRQKELAKQKARQQNVDSKLRDEDRMHRLEALVCGSHDLTFRHLYVCCICISWNP